MTNMTVTRHPPIRDQVAMIIRSMIIKMEFAPGQLLIERTLCDMTGASRPSVREAIRQLEAEGLVESQNGRGTVVHIVTPAEAAEVYQVRAELEGLAARLFTENATDDDREQMAIALDLLRGAIHDGADSLTILGAQAEFYIAMFNGGGNAFLVNTVRGMHARVVQLRAITLNVPGRAGESLREVEMIAERALAGDGPGAQRAASDHVHSAARAAARAMAETAAD